MNKDLFLSSFLPVSLGLATLLSGISYFKSSQRVKQLLGGIKNLDESIHSLKEGEDVILSGTFQLNSKKPADSASDFVLKILCTNFLNYRLALTHSEVPKFIIKPFSLGAKQCVKVLIGAGAYISGRKAGTKITTFFPGLFKFLLKSVQFFRTFLQKSEIKVQNLSFGYIRGTVSKAKGELAVKVKELGLHPHHVISQSISRLQSSKLLFFFFLLLLFLLLLFLKTRAFSYSPQTHKKCEICQKNAEVILKDCLHFSICRKCLLPINSCPKCGSRISSYIQVRN